MKKTVVWKNIADLKYKLLKISWFQLSGLSSLQ